ncbi:hypothetical protein [Pedobacter sp. KBS0701]|uniref:hypothetical protein n=1 Tax=unclassified Pedobacter TaxID=2628915 RepID=UPI00110E6C34|nr:hypothetical protein [Pedobacter sp. KBS0701]QDW23837.1 hypothetical protein FFJ24_002935 [Pedobacter sp. KBS0701]
MKKLIFSMCTAVMGLTIISSCGTSLKIPINRGKIDGDFTIQFTEKNAVVKPNQFFTLAELNIEPNKGQISKTTINSTNIKTALKIFKKQKIKNYAITITKPGYAKPYYGKIAFFNTNKINEADAVARYYEIDIANSYFASATRGRMAIIYEYSDLRIGIATTSKIPTWIVLISDEPF